MPWKANLPANARAAVMVSARRLPRGNLHVAVFLSLDLLAGLCWGARPRVAVLEGVGAQAGRLRLEPAGETVGSHVRPLTRLGGKGAKSQMQVSVAWPGYDRPFGKTAAEFQIEDGGVVIVMPEAPPEPGPDSAGVMTLVVRPEIEAQEQASKAMLEYIAEAQAARKPAAELSRLEAIADGLTGSAHRYLKAFIEKPVQTRHSLRLLHDGGVADSSIDTFMINVRKALLGSGWKIDRVEGSWVLTPGEQAFKKHRGRPSRAGADAKPKADPKPAPPALPPRVKPAGVPAAESGTCAYLVPGAKGIAPCGEPASGTYCDHHRRVSSGIEKRRAS